MSYITVIGGGSWGTALAVLLARKNYDVTLWAHETDLVERMRETRINDVFLPDVELPENLDVTHALEDCVPKARYIVCVVPTQYVRKVFGNIAELIKDDAVVVSASKGIEKGTLKTVSEILGELLGNKIAVLSGPSFAKEVVRKVPTAVTLASYDSQVSYLLQEVFNTEYFRVYSHFDVKGVEIGGALKNVLAIASGICEGLELGRNTRAALITRGIAEMLRLGLKMGAEAQTFSGLSGMGDIILTCTSTMSRNYTVGVKIGQGMKLAEIVGSTKSIAEGVETSISALELARSKKVEMPIVEQVYSVLHEDKGAFEAVKELMNRPLKTEFYME